MSYTIYHADGTPVIVPDNAIDTAFYNANSHGPGVGVGTQLVGRNAINYGAPIAQNFLQMTENFASTSAYRPGDAYALQGQLWFEKTSAADGIMHVRTSGATTGGAANWKAIVVADSTTGIINVRGGTIPAVNPASTMTRDGDIQVIGSAVSIYANSAWHPTGSTTAEGPTAPINPTIGQLWYDTVNSLLKVYTSAGWVEVNTGGGTTTSGPTPPTNPILGELWYNTTTNVIMAYTTSGWVPVSSGGGGGSQPQVGEPLYDSTNTLVGYSVASIPTSETVSAYTPLNSVNNASFLGWLRNTSGNGMTTAITSPSGALLGYAFPPTTL